MEDAPDKTLLSVRNLTIAFTRDPNAEAAVDNLSFDLRRGETLAIVGESGSGKSVSVMSLMQLLPRRTSVVRTGSALFEGRDLIRLDEAAMNEIRGARISMVFQEPMTSLNPVLTIGLQLMEVLVAHRALGVADARREAVDMLRRVRIADPERRFRQYPHQLSGGMRQRVMIAMALACRPSVLIADEPTTALDVTIQAEILELLREMKREFGTSILLITHDMGVVAQMADRVVVMRSGRKVEEGEVARIFTAPGHPYTQALLQAAPRLGEAARSDGPMRFGLAGGTSTADAGTVAPFGAAALGDRQPVLEVRNLAVRFDVRDGLLRRLKGRVHAVDDVSFSIAPGETLALVGESGCGKSTTGRAIIRLDAPASGEIWIDGYDVSRMDRHGMRPVRRSAQMIFQDPFASLNPRLDAGYQVAEPMAIHGVGTARSRRETIDELFLKVGLSPDMRRRYPHEFSGGQRQRLCIARALALQPKLIIADEAVSALDVSIQAQVVNLMIDLQREFGIAYLFISHDMAVVERIAHRVAVMRAGRIVEIGPRASVFARPAHSYTQRLLAAVPIADPAKARARILEPTGDLPSPIRPVDHIVAPVAMREVAANHYVAADA